MKLLSSVQSSLPLLVNIHAAVRTSRFITVNLGTTNCKYFFVAWRLRRDYIFMFIESYSCIKLTELLILGFHGG
jgi:hypothetical protein